MNKENIAIFDIAKRMANGLSESLGKKCEVVVHDFSDLSSSLIHIAGDITGRNIGAPITDLAFKAYKEQGSNAKDLTGYRTIINGRILKSSTIFLKNGGNTVIGCMCINMDVTDFLNAKAALDEFTAFPEECQPTERFASSFQETLESILEEVVREMGRHPATMDKEERLEFIQRLNTHDVFVFKGAVNQVAQMLGVTRYTVYNDLKELRQAEEALQNRGA